MGAFIQKLHDGLRSGSWLTRERIRLWALAALAASLIGLLYLVVGANGLNDSFGRPLGTDFSSFYAAGTLVRDGTPASVYDHFAHAAREQAIFGPETPYYAFQYPPVFLLVAGALATLPYLLALALWQGVTLILYLLAMQAILSTPSRPVLSHDEGASRVAPDRFWLLLAVAFPAVFLNLGHGQNGFLTTALLAGALVLLDRRPLIAGLLIGCMIYKPQFGLMIPLVLLTTGRWRVIFAAAATVLVVMTATWLLFGTEVWRAFFGSMEFSRTILLEQGDVGFYKMQSVFTAVRMWGGAVNLAYLVQGAVTVAVALSLIFIWRNAARTPFAFKAAGLVVGSFLATPFSLDYDMMVLAIAIAIIAAHGLRNGFAPFEVSALAALWIVPLVARSIAQATLVPIGIIVVAAFFVVIVRRGFVMRDESTGTVQAHLTRT